MHHHRALAREDRSGAEQRGVATYKASLGRNFANAAAFTDVRYWICIATDAWIDLLYCGMSAAGQQCRIRGVNDASAHTSIAENMVHCMNGRDGPRTDLSQHLALIARFIALLRA
jgi:hypothetical protein